ncbi:MAG: lyase family protein, partial [Betaproteobacteria bacterium]
MTLIELMIAMVLGLVVAGAAVVLFATNKLTYTSTENMGRIQESSRVAFELMSRDLRDAGGIPCDSSLATTMQNGLIAPTTRWWSNWDNGLRGYGPATEFTAPIGTAAFGTAVAGQRVAGTDAIELKAADPLDVLVSADVSNANRSAAIPVNNVTGLQANDLLVVCDYHGATIFQATSFTGTSILHVAQAKAHQRVILPGYTHLQRAQPVSLAHHLLAY